MKFKFLKSQSAKEVAVAVLSTAVAVGTTQYVNHKIEKKEEKFRPDYEEIIESSLLAGIMV